MKNNTHFLSKFQKNEYLQLFIIFGTPTELNKYLNTFFQSHCSCRFTDLYKSNRNELFHAKWIGLNNSLDYHLTLYYNELMSNLNEANDTNIVLQSDLDKWNQIAQYQCEVFLFDLNKMYQKNRALEEFGFNVQKLIYTIYSNFNHDSFVHLSTLNRYLDNPIYGKMICYNLKQINLDLWKISCLGKFENLIFEFIFLLKSQYLYYSTLNNSSDETLEHMRIYLNILQYNYLVSQRILSFLKYIHTIPKHIWTEEFIQNSSRWIPALNVIKHYTHSDSDTFNDLFLNGNEDFYYKYPNQILNIQIHPLQLAKIQYSWLIFDIVQRYRNQITLFIVLNTYLTFFYYCISHNIKKLAYLNWASICIYCCIIYIFIKCFNAKANQSTLSRAI